jgi:hypothetical protein
MSPREDGKTVRCVLDWGHQNGMVRVRRETGRR